MHARDRSRVFLVVLFVLFAVDGAFASGARETTMAVSESALPESARADRAFPLNVFPDSLVFVWGTGFGTRPVSFSVGGAKVVQILTWKDDLIAFRFPKAAEAEGSLLSIASQKPIVFRPAGETAQTVRWTIDFERAQKILDLDPRSLANAPPLHLFRNFSIKLELDVPALPLLLSSRDEGFTEVVLEAPSKPLSLAPVLFSLTFDPLSGPDARKAGMILVESWAKADPFELVSAAPAFAWAQRDSRFDPTKRLLSIRYPETSSKR